MYLLIRACILLLTPGFVLGQGTAIFAHNDYLKTEPLHAAYRLQVEFVEVDIFLVRDQLLVGHTQQELKPGRTLDSLYLIPLQLYVNQHHGYIYADTTQSLALVIDLKTGGNTVTVLLETLHKFKDLVNARNLRFILSGSVPDRSRWSTFPDYLHIDGRPGIPYTQEQLKRIALISCAFPIRWNGVQALEAAGRATLVKIQDEVQGKGKPLRFWAAPDHEEAWTELIKLEIPVINTDDPARLTSFLSRLH